MDRSALNETLDRANELIHRLEDPAPGPLPVPEGKLYTGVDLGTAYLTVVVLDKDHEVLAGEYTFAEVARDGLVVDYIGAVDLVREMKARLETRLGRELTQAASGYPPGVPPAEVRATANVVEAGGFVCTNLVDEPTAANSLVCLENGVIVDVGGGTTGIAVVEGGKVVYSADEATGGTHFSLVIAGARDIPYAEAERLKLDPLAQPGLFPTVRPVMEKISSIVSRHIDGRDTPEIVLVGGTSKFHRTAEVVEDFTGISAWVPAHPEWVTPIGMAMNCKP
ncbi:MAG: ethanolamine utilization protein EutJ [Anaerolineales bacterium]|nr:ethanolamine utilization protein EutJ [Anaerolineales bacterium]